jgi:hypothetical protein
VINPFSESKLKGNEIVEELNEDLIDPAEQVNLLGGPGV